MIRLLLVLLCLSGAAQAAPAVVTAGEHDGFTRLVIDFGMPVTWTVGRMEDGYALRIDGAEPDYNLQDAFRAIGKSRLAALWVAPEASELRLAMACGCHATPFEFRPGIVVIDISDGPPPAGSPFEGPLSGLAPEAGHAAVRPPARPPGAADGLGWADRALADMAPDGKVQPPTDPAFLPTIDPALQPLREALLRDLSAGQAEGVITMRLPAAGDLPNLATPEGNDQTSSVDPQAMPGLVIADQVSSQNALGAQGQSCVLAKSLDLAAWRDDRPVSDQIAGAHAGLVGEFDHADAEAVLRSVRFHLAIGFGAEARQLITAFPDDGAQAQILQTLSYLVDSETPPHSAFEGQEACDTPAALWAILANGHLTRGDAFNRNAALQAFSALPPDLRASLGPALAMRFTALGQTDATEVVRNAILRTPNGSGPEVALMQAKLDIAANDSFAAEQTVKSLLADPGPQTRGALVALVDARTAQDLPVTAEMAAALAAVVQELSGLPEQAEAERALIWAEAASGDFDAAFASLQLSPDAEPRLWRLLARLGTDDALLAHAVRAADAPPPDTDQESMALLATRLLELGLAEESLLWAERTKSADPMLLSRIHLQRHDGRSALAAMSGAVADKAFAYRAEALAQMGDFSAAADVYRAADDPEAEAASLALAQDWVGVSERGPEAWKAVAASLQPDTSAIVEGPLSRAERLVAASAATQDQVSALLAASENP